MDLNLIGKTAVVCGSSQGLGLASAIELSLLGANVVLMSRNERKLADAVKQLDNGKGQTHSYLVADFASVKQVKQVIEGFVELGNRAQILVNNTGGPAGGPIVSAELSELSVAFESHVLCNHVLATTLLPGMKDAGYGRIINIISTSVKQPLKGLGVSNTIRAAVANWSKTWANETAAFGITVNNILPGLTQTERAAYIVKNKAEKSLKSEDMVVTEMLAEIPAGRMGMPHELGAAVAFLASPAAAYITGINLPVDGGRLGCL